MILALWTVNMHLDVLATKLHILRLVRCHYAVESEEQIQVYWPSAFGRAPAAFLQAQSGLSLEDRVRLAGTYLPYW
jgi:hypothetical protein